MAEALTMAEIEARFPNEWVLLDEPQTDEVLGVQGGKLVCHSKDRDEVDRRAIALRLPHCALLYTGTLPEGTAVAL